MKKLPFLLLCPLLLSGARFAPLPAVFPISAKAFKIEIPSHHFYTVPAKKKAAKPKPFSELEMRFRAARLLNASA